MFHRNKESKDVAKTDEKSTRSNQVALVISGVFGLFSIVNLVAFEPMLKMYGVGLDDLGSEQRTILVGLGFSSGMHTLLMTGLHVLANGSGAPETTLKATHTLSAVRTVLLTDAMWAAVRCLYLWVVAVPAFRQQGWSSAMLYLDSALWAALGFAAFATSRGEKKSALGGLVKAEVNAANLKIPEFNKKNDMFLFWIGISAVSAPLLLLLPGTVLNMLVPEKLDGASLAAATLILQFHGTWTLNELLTLVALASSEVLALEYVACRWLWVWGFGACIFSLACKEVAKQFGLPAWPFLAHAACYAALSVLAYKNLADFGKKTLTETLTGRSM